MAEVQAFQICHDLLITGNSEVKGDHEEGHVWMSCAVEALMSVHTGNTP